jgi:hypothetical protein
MPLYRFDQWESGTEKVVSSSFSSCCGTSYYNPEQTYPNRTAFASGGNGIALGIDLHDDPTIDLEKILQNRDPEKVTVSEVKTRNGTITVSIRHAW